MRVKNKTKSKNLQDDIAVVEKIKEAMSKDVDKDSKPEVSEFVKLYNNHHAFINSLEYTLEKEPSKIGEFIFNNWNRVFPERPFPTKGGTLQMLKVCIQYGYVMQAYRKHSIKPSTRFVENYHKALDLDRVEEPIKLSILDKCEQYNRLSQTFIEPVTGTEIETETKQKITSVTFNEGETEMAGTRVKAKSKRKPVAKRTKKIVSPKRATKTKEKGESKVTKCLDLLLKRKFDDDDILEKSGLSHKKFVTWYRLKLNRGEYKEQGYPTPRPKVEKIGGVVVKKGKIKRAPAKKKKKVVKKK